MARLAGMTLRERWSSWTREPFTSTSESHVSVWEKPEAWFRRASRSRRRRTVCAPAVERLARPQRAVDLPRRNAWGRGSASEARALRSLFFLSRTTRFRVLLTASESRGHMRGAASRRSRSLGRAQHAGAAARWSSGHRGVGDLPERRHRARTALGREPRSAYVCPSIVGRLPTRSSMLRQAGSSEGIVATPLPLKAAHPRARLDRGLVNGLSSAPGTVASCAREERMASARGRC